MQLWCWRFAAALFVDQHCKSARQLRKDLNKGFTESVHQLKGVMLPSFCKSIGNLPCV